MKSLATVIGDLVGSRVTSDRAKVHEAFAETIEEINRERQPATPLRITVGDEYQGAFETVGAAIQAAFRLRIALDPVVGVRHGIGWGATRLLREDPRVEDGPSWWAARAAIEAAEKAENKAATRSVRTWYQIAEEADGPAPAAINAALVSRDELFFRLDPVSVSVLSGMLSDMSQKAIAAEVDISPSAVSQRVRRDGLAAIVQADELLGAVR
ncbi:SatD family protein [Nocardioides albertanoniae]|uniref:SatD family protein n=1 Tax=Nocardioides albertanoniae TaxID=1175486 RepID=A0A543A5Q4_9ACTN|nr:SatD family protein [Nocardioides albertanoniae]TQL67933.1 SatD family protein [Nocardioides albertanoniae]